MKKILTILLMCFAASVHMANAQSYVNAKEMHIFGLGFTMNDSIVYLTEVMQVEGTSVEKKTCFLYARNEYSYQFRDHLQKTGVENATVMVSFATKRSKAESKYMKLMKRLKKENKEIRFVNLSDFRFRGVEYSEGE